MRARPLLALLLLAACGPDESTPWSTETEPTIPWDTGTADTGEPGDTGLADTGEPDTGDTGVGDTGEPADTDDTGTAADTGEPGDTGIWESGEEGEPGGGQG